MKKRYHFAFLDYYNSDARKTTEIKSIKHSYTSKKLSVQMSMEEENCVVVCNYDFDCRQKV